MLKELLYFTKQERKHFYILIVIMLCLLIVHVFPQYKQIDREAQFTFLEALKKTKLEEKRIEKKTTLLQLTTFDPNQVTEAQLIKMGLPKHGIKSLLNYRKLGGVIKDQKHFKKMYGFEKLEDKLLSKYLVFPSQQRHSTLVATNQAPDSNVTSKRFRKQAIAKSKTVVSTPPKRSVIININTTDTTELKTLYGIGSFRAKRIINFRNALGGFHDINQLYDTRYVPDSIITKHIDKFEIDSSSIHKIKINEAGQKDLAQHPFISWQAARIIYNYRKEHGYFNVKSELFDLHGLDSVSVFRILPYISTEIDTSKTKN